MPLVNHIHAHHGKPGPALHVGATGTAAASAVPANASAGAPALLLTLPRPGLRRCSSRCSSPASAGAPALLLTLPRLGLRRCSSRCLGWGFGSAPHERDQQSVSSVVSAVFLTDSAATTGGSHPLCCGHGRCFHAQPSTNNPVVTGLAGRWARSRAGHRPQPRSSSVHSPRTVRARLPSPPGRALACRMIIRGD